MKAITRRALLGGAVGVLAVSPFIIRNFRRTTQLSTSATSPISFEPLSLPNGGILQGTLNAVLSNDNKWLLVSYCFGNDCQAHVCYVPLDQSGLPDTFVELKNFGSQSVVTELGCSSLPNQQNGWFSYNLRRLEDGVNACSASLECISLRHREKQIELSSDSVLLEKITFQMQKWVPTGVSGRNHFWLDGQDAFISVHGMQDASLTKIDCGNVDGNRFHKLRPLLQGPVGQRTISRRISSNFLLDGKTIKFLEAPARSTDLTKNQWNADVDSYRSDPEGISVSLNLDGTIELEKPFPVPSFFRKTLITQTHCFFPSVPSGQFFLTASLEKPQDYFELRFSKDEIQLPDSGINYVFDPLLILPSGRHLLCVRDVGISFVGKAKELGLPLSTLGIVELPFKIG